MSPAISEQAHKSVSPLLSNSMSWLLKRTLDVVASALGLLLLAPLFAIVGLLIKSSSPGPVFYSGARVGRHGTPFRVIKFRTMRADSDTTGPGITRSGDDRVTSIGHFLRKAKLDELPQLINVLRGEMGLVGPRPEDPRYVAYYTPQQRVVLAVPPGFTSLASIRYRNEEALLAGEDWEQIYIGQIMPDKLRVDTLYLEHWSLGLDLRILLYTFVVLPAFDETDLL